MDSIKKELQVEASQETAFRVFTENMDEWWPRQHHVGTAPLRKSILETKPAGRWYTTHEDGTNVEVGYVHIWDPFGRLVLVWQIDGNYKCDPNLITEIEVNFIAEGPTQTRVLFEHRDLEKLRGGAKVVDEMDQGWGYILQLYNQLLNQLHTV